MDEHELADAMEAMKNPTATVEDAPEETAPDGSTPEVVPGEESGPEPADNTDPKPDDIDSPGSINDDDEAQKDSDGEDLPVEERRVRDAQRKMHEQAAELKSLRQELESMRAPRVEDDEVEQPQNVGRITYSEVADLIDNSQAAETAYYEALARADVDQVTPMVIAATRQVDPALAEQMSMHFQEHQRTVRESAQQASQQSIYEAGVSATNEFYTAKSDAREMHEEISGLIGANPIFQEMMESGDSNKAYTALDLAYHVARSLGIDQRQEEQAASKAEVAKERAAVRGFDRGQGQRVPAVDEHAGESRMDEFARALAIAQAG